MTVAASAPTIHVFTFKEGLLSRLAHDLRLRVDSFVIAVEGGRLTARVDTASIRVDCVMRHGQPDTTTLSPGDRREIEQTVATRVLDVARHPSAEWTATLHAEGKGVRVSGQLELCGRREPVNALARIEGDRVRAEVVLTPSRWGITPYRAMGGTLKVQDRVRVEVSLPIAGLNLASFSVDAIVHRWQLPEAAKAPAP